MNILQALAMWEFKNGTLAVILPGELKDLQELIQTASAKHPGARTLLEEFYRLQERDKFLTQLEMCGVDNWEGYDEVTSSFYSEDDE